MLPALSGRRETPPQQVLHQPHHEGSHLPSSKMSAQVSAEEDHRLARKRRADRIRFHFDFDAIFPAKSSDPEKDEYSTSANKAVSSTPVPTSSAPNQDLRTRSGYRENKKRKRQEYQDAARAPVSTSSQLRTQYADELSADNQAHIRGKRSQNISNRESDTTNSITPRPVHFLSLPFEIRDKVFDVAVLLSPRYAGYSGEMLRGFVEFYCRKKSEVDWNELDALRKEIQGDAEDQQDSESGKSKTSSSSSGDHSEDEAGSVDESSDYERSDIDAGYSPIHGNE